MLQPASLGIDVGSTGCRFAVVVDGQPLPLWVPRQFDEAISQTHDSTDPAGAALAWKDSLGRSAPFGPVLVRELLERGLEAATPVLGQRPQRGVLCVPAAYPSAQRQVLHQSALAAGLTEAALISDTLALAVAHAQKHPLGDFLVYHCGHLGLEVAVVSVLHGSFNVLSYRTNPLPSGRAVERLLIELLLKQLPASAGADLAARHLAPFRLAAALLRRRLQRQSWAAVRVQVEKGVHVSAVIQREEWERAVRALVSASLAEVDAALALARLRPVNVTEVLLAGGPTALPIFPELLASYVGRAVLRLPPWSAAFGAALLAGQMSEAESSGLLESPRGGTASAELFASPVVPVREQDDLVIVDLVAVAPVVSAAPASPARETRAATATVVSSLEHKLARRALEQARELLQQNRLGEAVSLSHQAYKDDSANPEILTGMLDVHRLAAESCNTPENYAQALEWLLCANGHAPGHIQIRQALADRHRLHGWQMLERRKIDEAAEAARRAFQLRPECPETERLQAAIVTARGG